MEECRVCDTGEADGEKKKAFSTERAAPAESETGLQDRKGPFRAEPCLFCTGSRVQNTHKRQHGGKSRKPGRHVREFNGSHKPHGLYLPPTQGRGHSRKPWRWLPQRQQGRALMHYYGSHLNVNAGKMPHANPERPQALQRRDTATAGRPSSDGFSAILCTHPRQIGHDV